MVYNTQGYWIFGLCPSSDILQNRTVDNAPETGSVSVLGEGWETPTLFGPLERVTLNRCIQFAKCRVLVCFFF
jgi:hypothetical protein